LLLGLKALLRPRGGYDEKHRCLQGSFQDD